MPIFQQGGWFDPYSGSHLRSFAAIGDRVPNRVLMGPWSHEEEVETFTADVDLSPALTVIRDHELAFYDRYLRDEGNDWEERPPLELYVLGARRVARRERVAAARHRGDAVVPAQRRPARPRRAALRRAGRPLRLRPRGSRCRRSAASTRC